MDIDCLPLGPPKDYRRCKELACLPPLRQHACQRSVCRQLRRSRLPGSQTTSRPHPSFSGMPSCALQHLAHANVWTTAGTCTSGASDGLEQLQSFEGRPAPPVSSIHAQGRILSFCLAQLVAARVAAGELLLTLHASLAFPGARQWRLGLQAGQPPCAGRCCRSRRSCHWDHTPLPTPTLPAQKRAAAVRNYSRLVTAVVTLSHRGLQRRSWLRQQQRCGGRPQAEVRRPVDAAAELESNGDDV